MVSMIIQESRDPVTSAAETHEGIIMLKRSAMGLLAKSGTGESRSARRAINVGEQGGIADLKGGTDDDDDAMNGQFEDPEEERSSSEDGPHRPSWSKKRKLSSGEEIVNGGYSQGEASSRVGVDRRPTDSGVQKDSRNHQRSPQRRRLPLRPTTLSSTGDPGSPPPHPGKCTDSVSVVHAQAAAGAAPPVFRSISLLRPTPRPILPAPPCQPPGGSQAHAFPSVGAPANERHRYGQHHRSPQTGPVSSFEPFRRQWRLAEDRTEAAIGTKRQDSETTASAAQSQQTEPPETPCTQPDGFYAIPSEHLGVAIASMFKDHVLIPTPDFMLFRQLLQRYGRQQRETAPVPSPSVPAPSPAAAAVPPPQAPPTSSRRSRQPRPIVPAPDVSQGDTISIQPTPAVLEDTEKKHPIWSEDIKDSDVLFGRGGYSNHHIGNKYFRALADAYRQQYTIAGKGHKKSVAIAVVRSIRANKGRFLKEDSDGHFYEVGDDRATAKASQILREVACLARRTQASLNERSREGSTSSEASL